jgi:hypothetical protein
MTHYTEEDLTLYYYGEGRRRGDIEQHLDACATCAAAYREIAGTLAIIAPPDVPERGDQYGLEVWQRIRHRLPEQRVPWWAVQVWFRRERLAFIALAATLIVAAFVAGRVWPRQPGGAAPVRTEVTAVRGDTRQRILLSSVADHLDRSDRVLTEIINASEERDISAEQGWAEDLLNASRLYRQDAEDLGERSVADVLDELERSLLEIVHAPSRASAADLDQIRRRIDAAALLFKVRVLERELRQREGPAVQPQRPKSSTGKVS